MTSHSDEALSEGYFRWRCRRGMKELDFILNNFVKDQFVAMDTSDKKLFNTFLDEEDMLLWYWLSGKTRPEGHYQKYIDLVEQICAAGYHKK